MRAVRTTSAPAAAKVVAIAAPMPLPAPVMMATWSVSRKRSAKSAAEVMATTYAPHYLAAEKAAKPQCVKFGATGAGSGSTGIGRTANADQKM
ncbi:unannotated protein [freshwater metagenome]|uniref:Unannotated protein n=1 Tax=freshwater metagenome TaxID=449393 RepID=A0A6J6FTM1_9ZZZZ